VALLSIIGNGKDNAMITGDKLFDTLEAAITWGKIIAEGTGWKYKGAAVMTVDGKLQYAAKWEY